jgi:hypothetical protein
MCKALGWNPETHTKKKKEGRKEKKKEGKKKGRRRNLKIYLASG